MRLLFIRHADPNYEKDYITEKGVEEAKALGEYLKKENLGDIYCSPMGRARATADISLDGTGKTYEVKEWLKEFCHVVDASVAEPEKPDHYIWDFKPSFWTGEKDLYDSEKWLDYPMFEKGDIRKYYDEVCNGFDDILKAHGYERKGKLYNVTKENRDTLVFFCHFGVETVILSHLFNIPPTILSHHFVCLPTAVTELYTEEREEKIATFRCSCMGGLSHLYAKGLKPSFSARFCETFHSDERH